MASNTESDNIIGMSANEPIKRHERICKEMNALYAKKNHDYGGDGVGAERGVAMLIAERPLVWCPQCANCMFENNEPYCKIINGKWVKLPQVVTEQPGYCPRYEKKGKQ